MLVGEDARDLLAAVVDELADAEEDLRALRERRRAPGGERGGSGCNGRVDLLDGRERDLLRLLAGGRVVDGAGAPGRARHARAADPVPDLRQLARFAPGRRCHDLGHLSWSVARYHRVMATIEDRAAEAEKVVADDRDYLIHSWSVQSALKPLAVAGAEGRYFWDYDGKRYLDFASQLVNVAHRPPAPAASSPAIKDQADQLCTIGPPMANDKRSELARLIAEVMPGDLNHTFFTNGGAEANENAIKLARWVTGRQKVIARYRSYHGATAGAISLTGDPRRWFAEPGMPGRRTHARPVHVPLPRRPPRPVPGLLGRAAPRGDPPVRGRPHGRRRDHGDDRRHERPHLPARRLPPVDPRGLR